MTLADIANRQLVLFREYYQTRLTIARFNISRFDSTTQLISICSLDTFKIIHDGMIIRCLTEEIPRYCLFVHTLSISAPHHNIRSVPCFVKIANLKVMYINPPDTLFQTIIKSKSYGLQSCYIYLMYMAISCFAAQFLFFIYFFMHFQN